MSKLKINNIPLNEYLDELHKSHLQRIIVEGKGDHIFFDFLRESILDKTYYQSLAKLQIDTVQDLCDFDVPINGNKEKVIRIINLIKGKPCESNIMAFVDREFEDFEFHDGKIIDKIKCQQQYGRVIFSRGHSIENYLNTKEVLPAYGNVIAHPKQFQAIRMLEKSYDKLLRNACLLSLCGKEFNCLEKIRDKTLDIKIIQIKGDVVDVNFDEWIKLFEDRCRDIKIEELNNYLSENRSKINESDLLVLRWFSDGHITEKLFSKAYLAIMRNLIQPMNQESVHNKLDDYEIMNHKLSVWIGTDEAKKIENNPQHVFKLIGVWMV